MCSSDLDDPEGMESLQNNWMHLEGESMVAYKESRNAYEENLQIGRASCRERV